MILLKKYKVEGESMTPTFQPGDLILISYIPYLFQRPKTKDIVVIKYQNKLILKRITKIKSGKYYIEGDNKNKSTDSRAFGWISKSDICATVIYSNS